MADILPKEHDFWKAVFEVGWNVSELNDFYYIETPILEEAALFERGVGEATDIVEKEMYVFKTKGGERVAMRPENTAAVMRSYLENHLGYFSTPLKVFGDGDAVYDAEIILTTLSFFKALKLKEPILKLNTIGCRVCRPNYRVKLKDYYRHKKNKLCKDCERRYEDNIFRLLDCKEPGCVEQRKDAPIILDFLCANCNTHFRSVLELVEDNNIAYEPDPYLVRGLDYYNRTVFEVFSSALPDIAIAAGGRYDYLAELLGARQIPGVGVAIGIERVVEVMKAMEGYAPPVKQKSRVFFIGVGDEAKKASVKYINNLRQGGVYTLESLGKKSLKAQLKSADKYKAKLAVILGQREVFEGSAILRDMNSGVQETVLLEKLVEEVKKRLKNNHG
ncbi:MAG: Histidine-tRNA ligase [Candidatus Jorgensenbacteria bacterium GW2011_GWA1_48_13]|nr:MAG: Histidine-tRNA ligase [Candidatus Jorgensenbacteria bacterium GW2011_GWA1_48_13]